MNRFSVIYLLKKHYNHAYCETHAEATALLQTMLMQEEAKPVGIYDAKTELFYWEPMQQRRYNQSGIEEQGKLGERMITIAQQLRQRDEVTQPLTNSIAQLLQVNS